MSVEFINFIIIVVLLVAVWQIKGKENFFHLQFNWVSLLISLVAGFFTAAFTAGIIQAAYETEAIHLGSTASVLLLVVNIFVWYLLIDALRKRNSPSRNW